MIKIVGHSFSFILKQIFISKVSRYRTLPHVPNYPNWFWDQQISGLDRERFPNLKDIVDKDGSNSLRYDYNKFLQEGAPYRIWSEGLNNAQKFYKMEGVKKFNSFTSINIRPDHERIQEEGIRYISRLEDHIELINQEL